MREPAVLIGVDDPTSPDVAALIETHLAFAHEHTPVVDVHALAVEGLAGEDITFCTARLAGDVVAMGAVRWLGEGHAELKSMHTVASVRGQGVGRAVLNHLVQVAREGGCGRVSLETGAMDSMAPARAMYLAAGFVECPPFGDYPGSPNSVCMTMLLN